MSFSDELDLLLRARYPLLYIPTQEEERAEAAIAAAAKQQGNRGVYIWDFVDGYQGNLNDAGFGRRNPLQALELVEKLSVSCGTFIAFWKMLRSPANSVIWLDCSNLSRRMSYSSHPNSPFQMNWGKC